VRSRTSITASARIVALREEIKPNQYPVEGAICIIGRSDICQIIIPNKIVSRIQAVIELDESGHHILHDGNSANGTFVNGRQIRDVHVLEDQDEIGFGSAVALLRFESSTQLVHSDKAAAAAG